jgi:hypothetical protein
MVVQITVNLDEDTIERAEEEARFITPSVELASCLGSAWIEDQATLSPTIVER